MKVLLIHYDCEDIHDRTIEFKKFDSKEKMIDWINEVDIGEYVISAYEFYEEIQIEPFEKVTNYRIKK